LHEAASHRNPRTAVKHSLLPRPTATTAPQLPHASRPTPLRTRPGKCRAQSAMCQGPAVTRTQPALTPRLASTLARLQRLITVTVAPATAASQMPVHPMLNPKMLHIDRVQVQAPWALPDRQVLLFTSISAQLFCDTSRFASVLLIHSPWSVFFSWGLA
jgi:hypothetical protein